MKTKSLRNLSKVLMLLFMVSIVANAQAQNFPSRFNSLADVKSFLKKEPSFKSKRTGLTVTLTYTQESGYKIYVGSKSLGQMEVDLNPSYPTSALFGLPWLNGYGPAPMFLRLNNGNPYLELIPVEGQENLSYSSRGYLQSGRTSNKTWMSLTLGENGISFTPVNSRPQSEIFIFTGYGKRESSQGQTPTKREAVHEGVDLGLSVRWATCNVGASSPSDYGDYYAWGETSTKSSYDESNGITHGKTLGDISGDPQYDVARAKWGGGWRMPTNAEFEELENNCTWTWTAQDGHTGYKITGKNGNSIFLPAAGWRLGTSLELDGELSNYWSSTPDESSTYHAYYLDIRSSYHGVECCPRYYAFTIRPVVE